MGDFEWVGTANLWKSAAIFSTGADEDGALDGGAPIEPVLAGTQFGRGLASEEQEEMGGDFDPRLSTAFAKAGEPLPPGAWRAGHRS